MYLIYIKRKQDSTNFKVKDNQKWCFHKVSIPVLIGPFEMYTKKVKIIDIKKKKQQLNLSGIRR